MKITIHRGTNQIGGCVTEIESGGCKVFIDFGEQLPGMESKALPIIEGLTCGDVSKSALFITHYHGDHIGKICDTAPDLPIYVGKTALDVYEYLERRLSRIPETNEAEKHKKILKRLGTVNTFVAKSPIKIGEIEVTPLFVDHSAIDAYMFIVKADGTQVLHTGDFRGHGFKSKGLFPTLKSFATNIDYIISEGTNIKRPKAAIQTEQALQRSFENQFKKNKYNFVLVSSTNIDRIFSLYHAAKKAKHCFVCDNYQAEILKIVSKNLKRHTSFYNIDYDQKIIPAGRFFSLRRKQFNKGQESYQSRERNPYSFDGKLKPYLEKHGFCMLVRANDAFKPLLYEYANLDESKIYYSMWDGYMDRNKPAFSESLHNFLSAYKVEYMHTSGHADFDTLKEVFDTIKPKRGIIPIHTEAPEQFRDLFPEHAIISLQDGEVLYCNS